MSVSNGERAPPKAQPNAPSYADLRRRVLLFASLFCVFVLLVAFAGFGVLRQSAIQAAEKRSRSYSTILSAHLDRTMNALESRLTQIGVQSDRLGVRAAMTRAGCQSCRLPAQARTPSSHFP